MMHGQKNIL